MNRSRRARALIVGVCEYANASSLEFSVADAQDVAEVLMFEEYGFTVETLFDEQATRPRLLKALHELLNSDADNLVFYFSGHGAAPPYGPYLCTTDASPDDLGIDLGH